MWKHTLLMSTLSVLFACGGGVDRSNQAAHTVTLIAPGVPDAGSPGIALSGDGGLATEADLDFGLELPDGGLLGSYESVETDITDVADPGSQLPQQWGMSLSFRTETGASGGEAFLFLESLPGHPRAAAFYLPQMAGTMGGCVEATAPMYEGYAGCRVQFPWGAGEQYRLRVSRTSMGAWAFTVQDLSSSLQTEVGTLSLPKVTGISAEVLERVHHRSAERDQDVQVDACATQPHTQVLFRAPSAVGAAVTKTPVYFGAGIGGCPNALVQTSTQESVVTIN
jgi:hypothetical protein